MSITKLSKLSNNKGAGYSTWSRPTDWLALPTLTVGQEKVVALVAVFNQTHNLFAIQIAGAYTVDWGDGTAVQNVATGVVTTHDYSWSALSSSTLTTEGFRQALVTITPQAANSLTQVNFANTPTGASANYMTQWRDIAVVGANVTSLVMEPGANNFCNALHWFTYVGPSSIASLGSCFRQAGFLRGVTGTAWTAHNTNFSSLFVGNGCLETVPLLDTTSATTMNGMFSGCGRLRSVPLFVTSSVNDMSSMFSNCSNLTSVPLFDTANVTIMLSMFSACVSLQTIPLFNTIKVTSMASMFQSCSTLQSIPAINMGACLSTASMFNGCASLTTLPATLDTSKVTDANSMFSSCVSLPAHPSMNLGVCANITSIFNNCLILNTINLPTTSSVTNFIAVMNGCISCVSVTLNMTAVASTASAMISSTGNLPVSITSMILTGLRFALGNTNVTVNEQMDATALNALYTSLGTASGAQTLNFTGNPGKAGSTPSIAIAKGWTLT